MLRELERMPCAEIGFVLGLATRASAALAWRSRDALVPVVPRRGVPHACATALALAELDDDGEPVSDWVAAHHRSCAACAHRRARWPAVVAAYRAALGVVAAPLAAEHALDRARAGA